MRTPLQFGKRREQGSILAYFVIVVIAVSAMVGVSTYVSQSARLAHRRSDMIAARQYAESGAVIAGLDVSDAYTNQASSFPGNLTGLAIPYALNSSLSAGSTSVYQRTISAPFSNQTVTAQIWVA